MRRYVALSAAVLVLPVAAAHWVQEPEQPTEQHEFLQEGVGRWTAEATLFMPGVPDGIPMTWVENATALGEYWVLSDVEGSFMGMPFKGHGQVGYDPQAKEFRATWIDNMSSFMGISTGRKDGDAFILEGDAPFMDGPVRTQWSVATYRDDGTRLDQHFALLDDDEEFMWMEAVSTRLPDDDESGETSDR